MREVAEKMKENLAVDVMLLTWMRLLQVKLRRKLLKLQKKAANK
jgi:hypothetical protein